MDVIFYPLKNIPWVSNKGVPHRFISASPYMVDSIGIDSRRDMLLYFREPSSPKVHTDDWLNIETNPQANFRHTTSTKWAVKKQMTVRLGVKATERA